ncbi:FadR/GntR family transcriptional regulator [Oceanibaculum pacificum]|uniref:Transcriptional regulator n=1 Tax=Oceanibaculum pacificum TaxID=580166 RepID=A0A154VW44_9PROT|nr:FCD domain-containing protein [Oceanibaculum pacificum]KZD05490.1 transcriptional regulator [Oceanibaculum pacificum]
MKFGKLDRAPSYRMLAETVEREILEGRLRPGDKLPTETAFAEQFAVNRSTVREGIRLLEESGLVRREGGRRLFVARPETADLASRMSRAMVMHEVTFRELWETMMALEPMAAELAAANAQPEHLEALAANLAETKALLADTVAVARLDIAFHALIAEAAGNRALLLAREALGQLFYPAFETVISGIPSAPERLLVAHGQVFRHIQAGNAAEARLWMERHIKDFKRGFDRLGLDLAAPIALPKQKRA